MSTAFETFSDDITTATAAAVNSAVRPLRRGGSVQMTDRGVLTAIFIPRHLHTLTLLFSLTIWGAMLGFHSITTVNVKCIFIKCYVGVS